MSAISTILLKPYVDDLHSGYYRFFPQNWVFQIPQLAHGKQLLNETSALELVKLLVKDYLSLFCLWVGGRNGNDYLRVCCHPTFDAALEVFIPPRFPGTQQAIDDFKLEIISPICERVHEYLLMVLGGPTWSVVTDEYAGYSVFFKFGADYRQTLAHNALATMDDALETLCQDYANAKGIRRFGWIAEFRENQDGVPAPHQVRIDLAKNELLELRRKHSASGFKEELRKLGLSTDGVVL